MGLDDPVITALSGLLRHEGYFQLPPQNLRLPLDAMADLVRLLDQRGWPLVFSFMYDEFWALYYRLDKLIEGLLGPGYFRLPDFWVWLVDPQRGHAGWRPHRDKGARSLNPDRTPKSITIWIPLSEATPLNGCMYVVPADRDPVYGQPNDDQLSHKQWDIRALPAAAGSVMCWTQALLHWGGSTSRREVRPRISVAFEFQAANVEPFNQPLTNPKEFPSLELRLQLIGTQILQYRHMYPLSAEFEALANSLLAP